MTTVLWLLLIHALGQFLGMGSGKGIERVVTDHQCLPASCDEGALPLEGLGCLWVKDTNKSLQMMIYSVLGTKGTLGLPMMSRNTSVTRYYLLLI